VSTGEEMEKISRILSYFELYSFYKGVFSPKHALKAFYNVLVRRPAAFPLTIDILVTDKCNLDCGMCSFGMYAAPDGTEKKGGRPELTTDEIERFLEECAAYGPVIHFGGGEPFCRGDMPLIIKRVKDSGMKCLVTTNGTMLDEKKIRHITGCGVDGVIFSLYGDRKRHDMITRREGSYSMALENMEILRRLRGRKTRIYASSVFLPENLEYLESLTEKVLEKGADGVKIEHLNFITRKELDAIRDPEVRNSFSTFVLDEPFSPVFAEKVVRAVRYLKKKFGGVLLVKPSLSEREIKEWYTKEGVGPAGCAFTVNSAVINNRGDVVPCQFFPGMAYGNIRDKSFMRIWTDAHGDVREQVPRSVICNRCCKR
jgi:MoaA/NifB/PqqE/SkfB family radical SAM enzyme